MRLRSQLAVSGGLGLAGSAALTGGALFLLWRMSLAPMVSGLGTWFLLGFLLFFSVAEIPLMIFGMRRMLDNPSGGRLAALTNTAFTFFAAVYAAPFLLLTGRRDLGVALACLSLLRFASALWLVPGGRDPALDPRRLASSNSHPTSNGEES